jgi:hypothetical protein
MQQKMPSRVKIQERLIIDMLKELTRNEKL